jgi:Spy/CpxP family protein refolding chaperone
MKFFTAIALLLLSILLVPPLSAQNSYSEFERGLNLTDVQKRRAEDVKQKYIEEWQVQRQETLRKRLELKELKKDPATNRDKIDRTQRELRDLERSRERSYGQYRSDLSHVLNERQREQYNHFAESERKRRVVPQGPRGTELQGNKGWPQAHQGFRGPEPQSPKVPEVRGFDSRGWERRGFQTKEYPARNREIRGHER